MNNLISELFSKFVLCKITNGMDIHKKNGCIDFFAGNFVFDVNKKIYINNC